MMNWTLWRGQPLLKWKKNSIRRAGYGGAPATPGVMAPTDVCAHACARVYAREREREIETLWMMVIRLALQAC
jgi:hypothetical protein